MRAGILSSLQHNWLFIGPVKSFLSSLEFHLKGTGPGRGGGRFGRWLVACAAARSPSAAALLTIDSLVKARRSVGALPGSPDPLDPKAVRPLLAKRNGLNQSIL